MFIEMFDSTCGTKWSHPLRKGWRKAGNIDPMTHDIAGVGGIMAFLMILIGFAGRSFVSFEASGILMLTGMMILLFVSYTATHGRSLPWHNHGIVCFSGAIKILEGELSWLFWQMSSNNLCWEVWDRTSDNAWLTKRMQAENPREPWRASVAAFSYKSSDDPID